MGTTAAAQLCLECRYPMMSYADSMMPNTGNTLNTRPLCDWHAHDTDMHIQAVQITMRAACDVSLQYISPVRLALMSPLPSCEVDTRNN